ncbi:MAG TPA: alkaline phosphatase family protein [Planctomycetota bacterium]|nr:alkaline phosphatase family protein [Planctomycetota bacterium]
METRSPFRAALSAWTAIGAAVGLAYGALLLARNVSEGLRWQAPAILIGGPTAVFLAGSLGAGLVAGLLARAWSSIRTPRSQAVLAGVVIGAWAGYEAVHEFDTPRIFRFAGMAVGAVVLGLAGGRLADTRPGRAIGRAAVAIAVAALASFGAATLSLRSARAAETPGPHAEASDGAAVDPRDFVPTFEPLAQRPERDATPGRVLLLGIDGATWDRVDPLVAKGRLPNFARLKREGATARLRTMTPTISATIWTSVATGQLPSVHGIYNFVVRRASFLPRVELELTQRQVRSLFALLDLFRVAPVTSNLRGCKAIWNVATEMGLRTCVVGWWASYPVEPIDGWMVSDVASTPWLDELKKSNESMIHFGSVTHPPELFDELRSLQRSPADVKREDLAAFFPVDDASWAEFGRSTVLTDETPLAVFRGTYLRDELFANAALAIDAKHRPDLVLCYVRLIDVLGHHFWQYSVPEALAEGQDPAWVAKYAGMIDHGYEWADRLVGRFLERVGPNDVLVVLSDHGWHREGTGNKTYGHYKAPDGILAILGAGVRRGATIGRPADDGGKIVPPHVLDVAPTLFHLLGLPKGDDMPGRVLAEAFEHTHAIRSIPTWETTRRARMDLLMSPDAAAREAELRGVGYLGGHK